MTRAALAEDFGILPVIQPCRTCGDFFRSEALRDGFGCKACFIVWYDYAPDPTDPESIGQITRKLRREGKAPCINEFGFVGFGR